MEAQRKYPDELRERAVRLVLEIRERDGKGAGKNTPEAFENHSDFFHPRHVAVIAVQVPTDLIGTGLVHGWATVSLHGHAPDVQVARWGSPSSRTC